MARRKNRQHQKVKPLEQVLTISELGWHGDGLADVEGKRIFVPFTLAGETVRAMVTGNRAKILEIIEPSPQRIKPPCPHFTHCGGCAVQHLDPQPYADWKRHVIVRALENRDIDSSVEPLVDAHGDGRRRVTLHTRFISNGVQAGFMQAHSHKLIDLDRCPILDPELEKATAIARDLATPLASHPKPLDIQITVTESGLDCDIRGAGELSMDARMGLSDCAIAHDLARITVAGDLVLERRPPILTFGAAKVTLPPAGFLQATKAGEEILAGLVFEAVGDAKKVADLYCGIGPFSLRLADHCQVAAFDSDEAAITALTGAAHRIQGQKPVTAQVRDLIHNPLHATELKGFDAVVFDPPRAGAESQAIEIAQSKVPTVVAVSCNPATFAHDAAILIDGGYKLEKITPVDQFRYAGHIEMVGVFQR
jgi:23S rRNA (uracil1939-C5)-methyltransferase